MYVVCRRSEVDGFGKVTDGFLEATVSIRICAAVLRGGAHRIKILITLTKSTMDVASSVAPTNIAIVKYWGKDQDRGGNTPINSSCSLTLDPSELRAETVVIASKFFDRDELVLNGRFASIGSTHAERLKSCLKLMRSKCKSLPSTSSAESPEELKSWRVRVVSRNTFPTAAGLASSAAGYAALVKALATLYGIEESFEGELSTVARIGSGSACRSLYGGLVAWRKGLELDDSKAEQLVDEYHWPLPVAIVVLDAGQKETPSTEGMQRSVRTSPFLSYRAASVAEPRVDELKKAYLEKDFDTFAKICMRESNSFHATCLDTYPPISYMTDASRKVCKAVHAFNDHCEEPRIAYTFDAGPNAVLFCKSVEDRESFIAVLANTFRQPDIVLPGNSTLSAVKKLVDDKISVFPIKNAIKMVYRTKVGAGASSPMPDISHLVDPHTGDVVVAPPPSKINNSFICAAAATAALIALAALLKKR